MRGVIVFKHSMLTHHDLYYRGFKYAIYLLLAWNVWWWFREDLAASSQTFVNGVTWRNVVEAFSSTIDTLAWVVLLLLFELETAVVPDRWLRGWLRWAFRMLRGICYLFIVYAFYGYLQKLGLVTDTLAMSAVQACDLVGTQFTYVASLDDYFPLTEQVCADMAGQPLLQIAGTQIVGTAEQLGLARYLALTDVVNSGTWILVVAALEGEVLLQHRGVLTDHALKVNKHLKAVLYAVLLVCAVYWGIDGKFIDFWDAFLWLVAFVFIELNIFEWRADSSDPHNARQAAPAM